MNIQQVLALAAAVKRVFETRTAYTEESFVELTEEQYAAWRLQGHPIAGKIYRVVPLEPTLTANGKLELNVVTESERNDLVAATRMIFSYCEGSKQSFECFEDRLKFAGRMMPDVLVPPEFRE
jgi:hypothetical protein